MGWRANWPLLAWIDNLVLGPRPLKGGDGKKSVFLDGPISWRVQSKPWQYKRLESVPVGTEIVVEVVPMTDGGVALFYKGDEAANFFRGRYSNSLHAAVSQARNSGYRVFAHAKRIRPGQPRREDDFNPNPWDSHLEVRSVLAADLLYWLASSPKHRTNGYYQLAWDNISGYHSYGGAELEGVAHEHAFGQLSLLGDLHSVIVPCTFVIKSRRKSGKPTAVDIVSHNRVIGELSAKSWAHGGFALQSINDQCCYGFARIQRRWSTDVDMYVVETEICVVQPDATFPINTDPFEWQGRRRWH